MFLARVLNLLLGLLLAVGLMFAGLHLVSSVAEAAHAASASPRDHVFPRGLPHAPSEGECFAYRCVWDAKHQGNGEGQSMILTRWDGGYVGKPITHRRAHVLQTLWCERKNVTCGGYED